MLKGQKGVTLVALVITIIVLLILAGVSISLVMGDNGVLTQAQGAVVAQKIGGAREKLDSAVAAMEMKYKTDWAKNTSSSRATTYNTVPTEPAGNVKTAFQIELEANGLTYCDESGTAKSDALPDLLGTTDSTVHFSNGTDIFKVTMHVDSTSGALVVTDLLAWDGTKFAK